jgi:hypothetical protein
MRIPQQCNHKISDQQGVFLKSVNKHFFHISILHQGRNKNIKLKA